ncbi:MAG: type II toxin-antitoxin system VapC family toxin [Chloroflexota bacterium]
MINSFTCTDAGLVIRLVAFPDDAPVRGLWQRWHDEQRVIVAPTLLYYEVTNVIHRSRHAGLLSAGAATLALDAALAIPIQLHGDHALHLAATKLAERFALPAAYDAHYLALAERLDAELWTADVRLARAVHVALPWVHHVAEVARGQ